MTEAADTGMDPAIEMAIVGLSTCATEEEREEYLNNLTVDTRARLYLEMRAMKKAIEDRAKELADPYAVAMNTISTMFLAEMNQSGESNKAGDGWRVTKSRRTNCSVGDYDALSKFIIANNRLDMMQSRLSSTRVNEYIDETGQIPPGVNVGEHFVVTFYNKRS